MITRLPAVVALVLALVVTPAAATVNSTANKTIVSGNGSQTSFIFNFIGVAAQYISVIFTDSSGNQTTLTQGSGTTQYQISLNAPVQGAIWGLGGTVTYNPNSVPIAAGTTLTIVRTLPLTQAITLQNQSSVQTLGKGSETAIDTTVMQDQQINEQIGRALQMNIANSAAPLPLPPAAQAANLGLCFDGTGNNVIACSLLPAGTVSSVMQPVVNAASQLAGAQQISTLLNLVGCINITSSAYGGAGDNSTDNTTPLNNALAALSGTGGCVYFPPGTFKFNSAISYNLPSGIFSVGIVGGGQDETILTWPNASGGITLNYANVGSSAHIRDLSLTTGTTNGGSAITLALASGLSNPAVTATSDVYRVTVRGQDGYADVDYWTNGVNVQNVSNIQFENLSVYGSSSPHGTGINLLGLPASTTFGVQYNVAKSTFGSLQSGIVYGSFIQGVTVDQSNFTAVTNCIIVPVSQTGTLSGLSVTNSQFNPNASGAGIITSTPITNGMNLSNNLFIADAANVISINLATYGFTTIVGNSLIAPINTNTVGIELGGALSSARAAIEGNLIFGYGTGIENLSTAKNVTMQGNTMGNFTLSAIGVTAGATGISAINNPGFNPIGIVGTQTMGASPFTYTAGITPETHYINQSATNTATIAKNGLQVAALANSSTFYTIDLMPGEQYTATWTTTPPTYRVDQH